jgi:hypothetical protein
MATLTSDLNTEDVFAMSDLNPKVVYQAYKEDQKVGPLARPLFLARMLAIAVAVLGAVPTGYNLYMSYMHGIPYHQVSHRLEQYELLVKNFDCKIDYRSVTAGQGTRVDVGACPKSGDIQLKLTTPSGKAAYEWIAFQQLEQATKSASWISLIATEALADEAPKGPQVGQNMQTVVKTAGGVVQFAQASGSGGQLQVVCQVMPEKGKVIRIVNEGGKCYRENVNAFQGKVEKREEVQCNTPCTGGKG